MSLLEMLLLSVLVFVMSMFLVSVFLVATLFYIYSDKLAQKWMMQDKRRHLLFCIHVPRGMIHVSHRMPSHRPHQRTFSSFRTRLICGLHACLLWNGLSWSHHVRRICGLFHPFLPSYVHDGNHLHRDAKSTIRKTFEGGLNKKWVTKVSKIPSFCVHLPLRSAFYGPPCHDDL